MIRISSNSGYTAKLYSARIWRSRVLDTCQPLAEISHATYKEENFKKVARF